MDKEITEVKPMPGFMELLPQDQIKFNQIKDTIEKYYKKFGFLPLDTQIIQDSNVLLAKAGGETEKQIYRFNKGDNDLCLRFDLTVPLARYVAMKQNELVFPFKRYELGKSYRGEKAQKGRYREFYQFDVDVIGKDTLPLYYDAELPAIAYNIFKELDFGDFEIVMSNRKMFNGLLEALNISEKSCDILRLVDKFYKIGKDNVIACLQDLKLEESQIKTIVDFISLTGSNDEIIAKLYEMQKLLNNPTFLEGINEMEQVVKMIREQGVEEKYFRIDLTITRGLDYYTGTVYETFLKDHKDVGSICSGGRYDNLASHYTKQKLPGVGISIGLTRLFYKLQEKDLIKNTEKSISKVLVVNMTNDLSSSIKLATFLRKNDINTEVFCQETKFKNKLNYANKQNIPFVAILGEDEIASNTVSLKNMTTGEQQTVTYEDCLNLLK